MPRSLTSETSVDFLRKNAKIWLKALRAGQPDARTRLVAAWPGAPDSPGLREIQYALAREYGFSSWIELKEAAARQHASRASQHTSPREQALRALLKAADAGDAAGVESVLTNHLDIPDLIDERGTLIGHTGLRTALHFAAENGNLEIVEVLLRHGANTRIRDSRYHATPAGWAHDAGRSATFARLLDAELDIFDAIAFDRPERIREILRRDPGALNRTFRAYLPADADIPPDEDLTPLEYATGRGKARASQLLAAHGAELSAGGHLARTPAMRYASFVRMACIDGIPGGTLRTQQTHAAGRLLRAHPELAGHDFYTAVICGDIDHVKRQLDDNPSLANAAGGPRGWTPLLYLCTARLPSHPPAAENAVEIARLLLDRGADPNAYYPGGNESIHYTVLASVIGRGEEQAPLHPRARELAALLLDRGAEPYDVQLFYNGFADHASHPLLADDDLVWMLELIYQTSLRRGRTSDWREPDWMMIQMGGYGGGAWYLLSSALRGNYLTIAQWALAHGASPNPPRAPDARTPHGTLYEQARRRGLDEFAELLAKYGAERREPSPDDGAVDDRGRLLRAAGHGQVEAVKRLLDLGVSPDSEDDKHTRPMHLAAYAGHLPVVQLLAARGAEIDPRDDTHHTTPIYWAWYGQRRHVVDFLAPLSRDVWTLVPAGNVARLRDVLSAEPRLARVHWEGGTPLFDLPEDEEAAVEIVRLFLAGGADAGFTRQDGATAATIANARGLTIAGDLLSRASR